MTSAVKAPSIGSAGENPTTRAEKDQVVVPLSLKTSSKFRHTRSLVLNLEGATSSVWVYDIARDILTRLAAAGYNHLRPVWTAGGERVAFASAGSIFWRDVHASGEAELLSSGEYSRVPMAWTPDGRSLVFVEFHPDTGGDIWMLSMNGDRSERTVLQSEFNERNPQISPDGRWITYQSDESGRDEIYVRPFPIQSSKRQVSSDGGTLPRWNPNGGELFYRQGDKLMAVDVRTEPELELERPRELFERATPRTRYVEYDVSRDGERFVMVDTSVGRKPPTHLVLVQNFDEELRRLVPTN